MKITILMNFNKRNQIIELGRLQCIHWSSIRRLVVFFCFQITNWYYVYSYKIFLDLVFLITFLLYHPILSNEIQFTTQLKVFGKKPMMKMMIWAARKMREKSWRNSLLLLSCSLSHFAFGHEAQEKEATIQLNIPHSEAVPLMHSEQKCE